MNFRLVSTLGIAFLAAASTAFAIGGVDAPPAPSEPHEVIFSQPKETRLENGVRVIVVERPGLPLLAADWPPGIRSAVKYIEKEV